MRLILVGGALIAAASVLAVATRGGSPARSPTLTLVRVVPLELRGTRFLAGERVRVTLAVARTRRAREVRADDAGSFTVRFDPFLVLDVCRGQVVVTATGSRSGTAVYRRQCRPPDPALPSGAPA